MTQEKLNKLRIFVNGDEIKLSKSNFKKDLHMVNEYKDLKTAYEDYRKLSELKAYGEYIGALIWRLPGSDARVDGKPSKRQGESLKYKSKGVIELENNDSTGNGIPSSKFIGEHVVPRKVIGNLIIKSYETKNLMSFDKFSNVAGMAVICLVTKDEDKLLRDNKLSKSMPADWDEKDVWARYKKAGIDVYEKQDSGEYVIKNL